jgi:hypothetical protein
MSPEKKPYKTKPTSCIALVIRHLRDQEPGEQLGQKLAAELIGKSHKSVPLHLYSAIKAGVLIQKPTNDGFSSYSLASGLIFYDPEPGEAVLTVEFHVDATTAVTQSVCKASERPPIRPARPMSIFHIGASA